MKAGIKFALWITLTSVLGLLSVAQQTPPSVNPGSPAQTQSADADTSKHAPSAQQTGDQQQNPDKKSSIQETGTGKVAGTSNDRLFYAMPNFLTLQGREKVPPLSSKDKFKVVALGTFDYFEYPWWGFLAAINQAENNEAGYGQGWAGYGKRYGSTAGDSLIENFLVGAVFPSVLHQDPRFYQSGGSGFFKRSGYALSRIVVTRSDSGKSQFNYSEVFGSAIAAGISTYSYHPRSTFVSTPTNPHLFVASERTLPNTLATWETQLTLDAITIAVKEFWPDIHRKLSHKTNGTKPEGADQR